MGKGMDMGSEERDETCDGGSDGICVMEEEMGYVRWGDG